MGRGVSVANLKFIDGFHGAWLHFWRARVRVCVQSSCVDTISKEGLHPVLTISDKIKRKLVL